MTVAKQEFDRLRIGLHAPTRRKHCLLDAEMPPDLDDARHRHARAIAQCGRQAYPPPRILRIVKVKKTFRIKVEGEADGAPRAVGPRGWIVDEPQHSRLCAA